jgi:hypothetical protein
MGIRLGTKGAKLRSKASRRRQSLKVNPSEVVRKQTQEEQNRSVIAAIEAKSKA